MYQIFCYIPFFCFSFLSCSETKGWNESFDTKVKPRQVTCEVPEIIGDQIKNENFK